jgi:hypothetical protein
MLAHRKQFKSVTKTHGLSTLRGYVRLEDFTAVTTNNAVFWDVTACGSCVTRRF